MKSLARAALAATLSLVCLDGFAKADAKVREKCINQLEARPTAPTEVPAPRTPCPLAIMYGGAGSPRSAARGAVRPARLLRTLAGSGPAAVGDARSVRGTQALDG